MPEYPILNSIRTVSSITGKSCKALRQGCKAGTIPHVRVGEGQNARFMINLPKYLEQLNEESSCEHTV